ncbi:RNA polymerase sigma factor [Streptomyces sp. NPDC101225]|uniref:RNA polymerase sigma factor n=1 Tax=Streptomyces sp. NPDC101225 TaxID=3366135 RepID=UPI0037F4589D
MELFPRANRVDDASLVAGLALGDEQAALAFVRRFQDAVYGLAVSVTRDPALAEDVSQEVFVRAWRAAGTYDPRRASALTWLLAITRNAAIDALRARRPTPVLTETLERLLDATLSSGADADGTARQALLALESERAVARLRTLPPEQARAVALAVLGGCTAAEVGRHEHIPLGTAKTRIRTGLRRLRDTLKEGSRDGTPP